jgi:LPS export ABC transporter protein LptC
LILFVILVACNEKKAVTQVFANSHDSLNNPDQISWNVNVAFNDSSYKKAIMYAKRARIYSERGETYLDGNVMVEFFSKESGKRISVLTSDSAKIDDKTRDMFSWGNVKVVSDSSQTTLESPQLNWNQTTRKLYSDKYVHIVSPTENIQGSGFESDQSLKNYRIFKPSGEKK